MFIYKLQISTLHIDGLVEERRNSSALAMELPSFLHRPIDMEHYLADLELTDLSSSRGASSGNCDSDGTTEFI